MVGDIMQVRKEVLTRARRLVVKVGSAVLTTQQGLDLRIVGRLADQLAGLHDRGLEVVLVSSGAVAAGRKVLGALPGKDILPARQAASAVGQSRLMHAYDEAFARFGKITAQVLLTRDDFQSRKRFLNARNTFQTLLCWRTIPIVNENDTVSVAELEFGDNDTLAALLLNLVEADLFVNLTSAEGVYETNPDEAPGARCLDCLPGIAEADIDKMCGKKTSEGSGGMRSKLLAARRAAQLGLPTLILSGKTSYALERAFSGECIGTFIPAETKAVSGRKFWLAYNQEPAGAVLLDDGAVNALLKGGKSLLPIGIAGVEGNFGVGALVRVEDLSGATIGVGLTNYKASDLRRIMGKKTSEIEEILGSGKYTEAIHRDNLLLDAAL